MRYNPLTTPFGVAADLIAPEANLTNSLFGTGRAAESPGAGTALLGMALPHIMELAADPEKKLNSVLESGSAAADKIGGMLDTIGGLLP
jgi:hypothetical protein